jgi:hypothetical protein
MTTQESMENEPIEENSSDDDAFPCSRRAPPDESLTTFVKTLSKK